MTRENVLSVAPMVRVTDLPFRHLMRCLSKNVELWTEMLVADAVIRNPNLPDIKLYDKDAMQPCVLQIAGDDPEKLSAAAKVAESVGYDEVNLNIGCPSSKIATKAVWGAALFQHPEKVARCVKVVSSLISIPLSLKLRLGVDELDSQEYLEDFINTMSLAGCKKFVIHSRKALLRNLKPSANRSIPPLQYERVYNVAKKFPDLNICLNGGVKDLDMAIAMLNSESAAAAEKLCSETTLPLTYAPTGIIRQIMIGRAARDNPCIFAHADHRIYGATKEKRTRRDILMQYLEYLQAEEERGLECNAARYLKPLNCICTGFPHSRIFKQTINAHVHNKSLARQPAAILRGVIEAVDSEDFAILDAPIVDPRWSARPKSGVLSPRE